MIRHFAYQVYEFVIMCLFFGTVIGTVVLVAAMTGPLP